MFKNNLIYDESRAPLLLVSSDSRVSLQIQTQRGRARGAVTSPFPRASLD